MAKLARLAHARGYLWTAFYNLYAAAVVEGDREAGFRLAEVLIELHPTHALAEVDEAFGLALRAPWARPASLTRPVVDYLMLDWRVECATEDTHLSTDDLVVVAERLANRELFVALLQTSVVSDLRLERLLIVLRDHLAAAASLTPSEMRLAALLATQAYLVEYLWPDKVGPVETQAAQSGGPSPVTAGRALQNSLFRPPTAAEVSAIEAMEGDPVISFLLERVRDEPARHARHREEIERVAVGFRACTLDGHDEPMSCTRWVTQPFAPRTLPLAVRRRLRGRHREGGEILVVGCDAGQELFAVRATHPRAHITALDASPEKLAYAALKCEEHGLLTIDFLAGNLLDIPPLGWTFDLIECLNMRRQLRDPDFGCEALARCTRPGSLLRLGVDSEATCRLVSALRASSQACGITSEVADLKRFRAELLESRHGALPPALLKSPDFYTVSGLCDLLFADREIALGASAWLAMLDLHGFDFLCEEATGEGMQATRAAGPPNASLGSVRDSRRDHPFAFGDTQFLWFERRPQTRR
jgi:hypothetical protein